MCASQGLPGTSGWRHVPDSPSTLEGCRGWGFPQVPGCPTPLARSHFTALIPDFLLHLSPPGWGMKFGELEVLRLSSSWASGAAFSLHILTFLASEPLKLRLLFATRQLRSKGTWDTPKLSIPKYRKSFGIGSQLLSSKEIPFNWTLPDPVSQTWVL